MERNYPTNENGATTRMIGTCSRYKTKHIPVHKVHSMQLCDKCNTPIDKLDSWGLRKHKEKDLARQIAAKKGA